MAMRILDVGQCGFDGPRMCEMLSVQLHANVDQARTADEAEQLLRATRYDLILVNRIFASDGESGQDFIARHADDGVPIMLVSDHDDAQEQAVKKGAVRGFGKSALDAPETLELIRSAATRPKR